MPRLIDNACPPQKKTEFPFLEIPIFHDRSPCDCWDFRAPARPSVMRSKNVEAITSKMFQRNTGRGCGQSGQFFTCIGCQIAKPVQKLGLCGLAFMHCFGFVFHQLFRLFYCAFRGGGVLTKRVLVFHFRSFVVCLVCEFLQHNRNSRSSKKKSNPEGQKTCRWPFCKVRQHCSLAQDTPIILTCDAWDFGIGKMGIILIFSHETSELLVWPQGQLKLFGNLRKRKWRANFHINGAYKYISFMLRITSDRCIHTMYVWLYSLLCAGEAILMFLGCSHFSLVKMGIVPIFPNSNITNNTRTHFKSPNCGLVCCLLQHRQDTQTWCIEQWP